MEHVDRNAASLLGPEVRKMKPGERLERLKLFLTTPEAQVNWNYDVPSKCAVGKFHRKVGMFPWPWKLGIGLGAWMDIFVFIGYNQGICHSQVKPSHVVQAIENVQSRRKT